jgi:hypothetical protein
MASVGFCPTGWNGAKKFPKRIRRFLSTASLFHGVSGEKVDHCVGEDVVAISGDHVPGTSDVDEFDLGKAG